MSSLMDVFVSIRADEKTLGPDIKKKLAGVDTAPEGKKLGGGLMKGLAAGVAAAGIGSMFSGFIKDAAESAKIGRLTEAVVKSTGGAAKITADQVSSLATAISNKTAVDDEAIQSGANMLLTFTKVRNEVGAGNDIFNQATQAAVDMSAALGTDMSGASMQLGKALNDPIKGVTALTRAGVSFTQQQKDQIKAMVEAGDTLGAQKLILGEMQTQFGGAAAAAADPMERLRVVAGNLGEEVGTLLLPYIEKFATFVSDVGIPALRSIAKFIDENRILVGSLAGAIGTLYAINKIHTAFLAVQAAGGLLKYLTGMNLVQWKTKAWAAAQWLLNAALSANPIGLVIAAVAALVAGFVIAYKNSETFRNIVDGALRAVADAGKWMWDTVLKPVFGFLVQTVADAWWRFQEFQRIVGNVWTAVKEVVRLGVRGVVDMMLTMAEKILASADAAFGWMPGIGGKLDDAKRAFEKFRDGVNGALGGINDRTVTVTADAKLRAFKTGVDVAVATGGPIRGPGTGTSDSIIAALSNGEHVWTAKEVAAAGGHSVVEAMRQGVLKRAKGGRIEVVAMTTGLPEFTAAAKAFDESFGKAVQDALASSAASDAPGVKAPSPTQGAAWRPRLRGVDGAMLPPGSYRVSSPFGPRRILFEDGSVVSGSGFHTGVDLAAGYGTAVYAPFAGWLSNGSGWSGGYGNHVRITAGALQFIGAHLSAFARAAGLVGAGDMIGRVGSTGNSTGPHLHAEVRRNGVAFNPSGFLKFAKGGRVDLAAMGRQLLDRTEGLLDHIHIAHKGGTLHDPWGGRAAPSLRPRLEF